MSSYGEHQLTPEQEARRQAVFNAIEAYHMGHWKDDGEPTEATVVMSFLTVCHVREVNPDGEIVDLYPVIASKGQALHETFGLIGEAEATVAEAREAE
jgi:hypothetical protein